MLTSIILGIGTVRSGYSSNNINVPVGYLYTGGYLQLTPRVIAKNTPIDFK